MNAQLRTVVVIALTAIALAYTAPDLLLPWHPWANYGMTDTPATPTTAVVTTVTLGGPAESAGIHVGDTIDLAAMPFEDRRSVFTSYNVERPGTRATFEIVRGRTLHSVTLVAGPHARTLADNITDVAQILTLCAFPIIAMFLLLARPGILTWAFFIYALAVANGSTLEQSYMPTSLQLLSYAWSAAFQIAGLAAFIIFALRFPSNSVAGWKRTVERVVLYVAVPLLAANLYWGVGEEFLAPGAITVGIVVNWFVGLGYLVGAAAFVATLVQATPQERPRVVWVIFGFLVGYAGLGVYNALYADGIALPIWLTNSLQTLNVLVPITVMYAILKHRVIDIRFFLNRALVYGILTTTGIGLLVLLDWAVAKRLESFGIVVEVAGALVLGVGIQHLHRFVDALVDRYVFRSVHEAEKHLERVSAAMMYSESLAGIDKMLVTESSRALQLRSTAVFRRATDQSFRREAAVGWDDAAGVLPADDPIALDLQAQKRGISGGPFLTGHPAFPTGAAAPAFAVPLCIRESVIGFALFGAHVNASDIDPNEQDILERFVARATMAYDHVSSVERAAENARMRIELDFLRGLVRPLQQSANVSD